MRSQSQSKAETTFDEVLTVEQRKSLEQYFSIRVILAQQGPFAAILQTELGKSLELTDAQRDEMLSEIDELRDEIESRIRAADQECWQKTFASLTTRHRAELNELIGAEFEHIHPSMLILEHAARDLRRD